MAHKAPQAPSNTLRLERAYPFLVGAISTIVLSTLHDDLKKTIATDLVVPILTILPIIIGFLVASLTLLYTIKDTPNVQRLQTSSAFKRLVDYHVAGIGLGSTAALLALAVLVACKPDNTYLVPGFWRDTFFYAWLLFTNWSFVAFLRVVFLLRDVMVG
jgi:hypothetical protein